MVDWVGGDPEVLEAERDLVLDPRHHDLILGVLEHRGYGAGERGGAVLAGVEARHLDAAAKAPAVEVRDEPREGTEQRRLAAAGRPEQRDDFAGLELKRDVPYGRHAAGIGERQAADSC